MANGLTIGHSISGESCAEPALATLKRAQLLSQAQELTSSSFLAQQSLSTLQREVNPTESFPFTIISPRMAGGLQTGLQSISPKTDIGPNKERGSALQEGNRENLFFTYSRKAERANLLLYTTKAAPRVWIGHLPTRKKAAST